MAVSGSLPKSGRFFSAFQRYISVIPRSRNCIQRSPLRHFKTGQCTRRPLYGNSTRRASTSTASAPPHQKPSTPILYDLFPKTLPEGPPPSGPFRVDTTRLRSEFLQLQARAHPDRHSGADKARAEGTSALINEAYKTLSSPLLRSQYLLMLRGIDVAENEQMKIEDPELLMEVMEVRESIEAAEEENELDGMKETNAGRISESEDKLEKAFAQDDIEGAVKEAVRLRYWTNIKESLHSWEKGKPVVLVH